MSELESWKTEVPATHFSRTRVQCECVCLETHTWKHLLLMLEPIMLGPGVEAYRPWTRRTLPRCPFYKTLIKCGMQMNSVCVYFTMRDRASGMGKKTRGKRYSVL